jgi:hypothetical protein
MKKSQSFFFLMFLFPALLFSPFGLALGSELPNGPFGMEPLKLDSNYQYLAALSGESSTPGGNGGESGGGGEKKIDLEALSKELDNPLGKLWILWTQNDTITLKGFPLNDTKTLNMTLIQPVLPVPLTKDWLWVSRPVIPIINTPIPELDRRGQGSFPNLFPEGGPSFDNIRNNVSTDRKWEMGDLTYLGMLAPQELVDVGRGKMVLGLGPSFIFPTATHDFLGSEKYSMGPGFLAMWMYQDWKVGVLGQQWWSYAGKNNRPDVSKANIQPIVYYQLPKLWQVGFSPNILVNWEAGSGNKYTVPLGAGVNKTTLLFDKLPVRFEADVYYAAIRPDDAGQRWTFRFLFIPVVPNPLKLMGIDSLF